MQPRLAAMTQPFHTGYAPSPLAELPKTQMRNSLRMMQDPILQEKGWLQHFIGLTYRQVCAHDEASTPCHGAPNP